MMETATKRPPALLERSSFYRGPVAAVTETRFGRKSRNSFAVNKSRPNDRNYYHPPRFGYARRSQEFAIRLSLASSRGERKADRDNPEFKNRRNQQQTNDIPKVNRDKNASSGSPDFCPSLTAKSSGFAHV
jgi:hypothetical protein